MNDHDDEVVEGRDRAEWPEQRQRLRPVDAADAVRALGESVEVEEHDRDDLAESEGHDRQVVAAQAERRRAEQDPEDPGDGRPDEEHRDERQVRAGERRVAVGVGVRADRKERGIAQVEQAGHADDDVEAHRQQHEDAGIGERVVPDAAALDDRQRREDRQDIHEDGRDRHSRDDRQRAMGIREVPQLGEARPEASRWRGRGRCLARGRGRHARSPVACPNRPDGLKISTNVRTMNTRNSDQRE